MTINNITILKSLSPLEVISKPSPKTIEHLGKIIADPQYLQLRDMFRKMYGVPPEGYDINNFLGKEYKNLPLVSNETAMLLLNYMGNSMRSQIYLADDFLPQLVLLFFFNAFIDLEYFTGLISQPINFVLGKATIAATMVRYPFEVGAILIPYTVSYRTVATWLKKNWKSIYKLMDDNLPGNPYETQIHKNMEIALEVIDLHEKSKYSFSKISTILIDKYPTDQRVADVSWVKKIYHDYKIIINSASSLSKPQ